MDKVIIILCSPVLLLADVAVLFLLIRLMTHVWPYRVLLFLDRIGATGVDIVTGTVAHQYRRFFSWPLSSRQEEALALLVVSLARWGLGMLLAALI